MQWKSRVRAELRFFLRALRTLIRPGILLAIITLIGTTNLHYFGAAVGEEAPGWSESLYVVFSMLLLEPLGYVPEHFLGQVMLFVLPLFGIFFVAEGVIKLGLTVTNKESNREIWMSMLATSTKDHIILAGLGTVGFRVMEELMRLGQQVFVIERNAQGAFVELARAKGAHVLIGDARAENLLVELNLAQARAVIVVTDDDFANLEIAMDTREINADIPIIMRMYDQRMANKVKATLGVEVSFSTAKIAAPLFATAALDQSIIGTHRVNHQLMVIMEIQVNAGAALDGTTSGKLAQTHGFNVIAVKRPQGNWTVNPDPDMSISKGDWVQLMVEGTRVREVHQANGEKEPGRKHSTLAGIGAPLSPKG